MIICSLPGCQTTAGCQCRNRAGVDGWLGQIKRDASILSVANSTFAAGRLAGLREAAEVARNFCDVGADDICEVEAGEWQREIAKAILALAEGKEG